MSLWFDHIQQLFLEHGNSHDAKAMSAYMKHRFSFYGIKTPQRKELVKQANHKIGTPKKEQWIAIAEQAFCGDFHREIQYAVGDLLRPKAHKKDLSIEFLPVVEELIQIKSWWDTVDWLSPKLAGGILLRHPEERSKFPDVWIDSKNKWLVRSAILFQLSYKDQMDTERLREYCIQHKHSDEFFIQKAMGWILREHSKTDREWVMNLFSNHEFPKLTVREGSKYL